MLTFLLISAVTVGFTYADYTCLCSYHIEREVYAEPNVSSKIAGYLYEFDCKPIVEQHFFTGLYPKWVAIANEHEINYVLTDDQIAKQVCPGNPSPADIVTTLKPAPTTRGTTPVTQRTISTQPSTTSTKHVTIFKTQSTATTTLSSTLAMLSTRPTTKTTTRTTLNTTSTTQTTSLTTHSTTSTTETTSPTTHSTTPTTQNIAPTIHSQISTTQTTTSTTYTTAQTATSAKSSSTPKTPSPQTTDWTLVPWPTEKTSPHSLNHHQTTHHSSHSSHTTVNVGDLSLCPKVILNLQDPGTRNLRQHGQWCYELRKEPNGDWIDAREDCFSYAGGFLVQIMNQHDQDFIVNFLKEEKVHVPIWIGINGLEEHFHWDSGVHVSFTNWDPNRKDNDGPHWKEDCGILKPNGLWDDSVCKGFLFSEHHHPWICQYHIRHHSG